MSRYNRWSIMGKYYGFPECCVNEFVSGASMEQTRKFEGTGYIPCKQCNDNVEKDELISYINENRLHPTCFPEDGNNSFNENVFRMFFSDKFSEEEKSFIKYEWSDIFDDVMVQENPIDVFFFNRIVEVPDLHQVISNEFNFFGENKKSVVYKKDAQLAGKMCAAELIMEMADVDNQPFGFSWGNLSYVRNYTFVNYVPFDGKEPKNIIELEKIAIEASTIEWKNIVEEQKQSFPDTLKLREYSKEEIITKALTQVSENFYNILAKEYLQTNPDKALDVFIQLMSHPNRVQKALNYSKKIMDVYLNSKEVEEIFLNKKDYLQKYYEDLI